MSRPPRKPKGTIQRRRCRTRKWTEHKEQLELEDAGQNSWDNIAKLQPSPQKARIERSTSAAIDNNKDSSGGNEAVVPAGNSVTTTKTKITPTFKSISVNDTPTAAAAIPVNNEVLSLRRQVFTLIYKLEGKDRVWECPLCDAQPALEDYKGQVPNCDNEIKSLRRQVVMLERKWNERQKKAMVGTMECEYSQDQDESNGPRLNEEGIEKCYEFIDCDTKDPFRLITMQTQNSDLRDIYNEQKRRKKNTLAPLVLAETSIKNGRRHTRVLTREENAPPHANSVSYKTILHQNMRSRTIHQLERKKNPFPQSNEDALRTTHCALVSLLGKDCECFDSVRVASEYYRYWRPTKPKVILLAESHVATTQELSRQGPVFNKSLLGNDYDGPVDFCSLVYCLGYGENSSLVSRATPQTSVTLGGENQGTWQFWKMFSACISSPHQNSSSYGEDVKKSSTLSDIERVRRKYQILKEMKERGIWLIDTSIIGWYIPQDTKYDIAKKSKKVTRLPNLRPHPKLKTPCLRISWEGYVKGLVREAANDGELQLLIPIGKDVENSLGKGRLVDAVTVKGRRRVTVENAVPAPNARINGGYSTVLEKIAKLFLFERKI